jgi:hypothetical protein
VTTQLLAAPATDDTNHGSGARNVLDTVGEPILALLACLLLINLVV